MLHDGMDHMGETYYRYFTFTRRHPSTRRRRYAEARRRGILHWRATYTFDAWHGNVESAAFNLKLRRR